MREEIADEIEKLIKNRIKVVVITNEGFYLPGAEVYLAEKRDQNGNNGMYAGGGMVMRSDSFTTAENDGDKTETKPSKKYEYKVTPKGVLVGNYKDYNTMSNVFMDIDFAKELRALFNKLNGNREDPNSDVGYNYVKVRVDDMDNVDAVETAIKAMGFETYSFETYRKPMKEQARTIQLILGSLGGISLLVAALGIANTMVMSIYERTREIGVMKVLGCKVGNIRSMFLMEAGCIGVIGGVVGVGVSYLASFILNTFLGSGALSGITGGGMMYMDPSTAAASQISIIPPWLVLLGLCFATMVGLVSGFYPANRAVKISALEAIKHE